MNMSRWLFLALGIVLPLSPAFAAPIPGLFNTGVDESGAVLPDDAVDPHYVLTFNPDGGSTEARVQDSTRFPIVGGPWVANTATSKWIGPRLFTEQAAGGEYDYTLTFDLTGFDPTTAVIKGRFASDNEGIIVLSGLPTFYFSPQFSRYTEFTLLNGPNTFAEGTNTLSFRVNNAALGYTGLRVELSGTALPSNSAPAIVDQPYPRSSIVSEGEGTYFTVIAQASPAPTYQWRRNGESIPSESNFQLILDRITRAESGTYDVIVSNAFGSVTSSVVTVTVGLPVVNSSFEADSFSGWPGYVNGNAPISGWNALGGHGLNPVAGHSSPNPFADNGAVPHGAHVAFMQADGPMTQVVSGFTPGEIYYVHYYENARTGPTPPGLAVTISDGTNTLTLVDQHVINPVGGSNPYREITSRPFVATASELTLAFVKSNPRGGDTTALIDNVAVVQIQPTSPPFITQEPAGSVVEVADPISISVNAIGGLPLSYQWRRGGSPITGATNSTLSIASATELHEGDYTVVVTNAYGAVTSSVARVIVFEPILGLFNTGVDNSGNALPDGAVDPHYSLIENPDGGSPDAIVQSSTVFPIVAGPWLANSATSKWIGPQLVTSASAAERYTYRTTIDLTGRDPSTVIILGRWATDNTGLDIQVNGVSTTNAQSPSFSAYTRFALSRTNAAFVAGPNTIDFIVTNAPPPGYTGLRVEIDQSNVAIPPGTAPTITRHPAPTNQTVAVGDGVSFSGTASGSAPLSYQWRRNGVPLAGQTNATLVLTNLTAADSGDYTLAVSNAGGTAVSDPATVCVCLTVVPGLFGTGVDESGALLGGGVVDPHYVMTISGDPAYPGPEAYVVNEGWPIAPAGPWPANGPRSRWIAPSA